MAVVPNILVSQTPACDELTLTEKTLPYTVIDTGGWGAPNIDTTDITDADIVIKDFAGNTLDTVIVKDGGGTDLYPSAIPAEFTLTTIPFDYPDGIYVLTYTIESSAPTVTRDFTVMLMCKVKNCMEAHVQNYIEECCTGKLSKLETVVSQLELFESSICAAMDCGEYVKAEEILAMMTKYCDNADCSC